MSSLAEAVLEEMSWDRRYAVPGLNEEDKALIEMVSGSVALGNPTGKQ